MELAPGYQQLKAKMRGTWMAGDFGRIAQYMTNSAEEFVDRLKLAPGTRVLDVACGTGNAAIPAGRTGASVTGVDIAPNLLDQARERAAADGVEARFEEGDAEALPYPDAGFDVVMSMFGAMFAPRPERVVSELTRVCRSGGVIAMANWTPQGFAGKLFAVTARHVPPPDGIVPPLLWGDEETVRKRFADSTSRVDTVRRRIESEFPFPPHETVQLFRDYFGPTQVAFSRLDPAGQAAFAADLEALWSKHNKAGDGSTRIQNEYLEVTATRA